MTRGLEINMIPHIDNTHLRVLKIYFRFTFIYETNIVLRIRFKAVEWKRKGDGSEWLKGNGGLN